MSDSNEKMLELKADFYAGVDDFTFFRPKGEYRELFRQPDCEHVQNILKGPPWDGTARLRASGNDSLLEGRLHVSRCFDDKYLSCSFRANPDQKPNGALKDYHLSSYEVEKSKYNPGRKKDQQNVAGGPKTDGETTTRTQGPHDKRYLTTIKDLCTSIDGHVFDDSDARGLIIVSGATAVGKSQIARGLIYAYLKDKATTRSKRRPHLVTYEDPIDVRWADDPEEAKETGIDYTPCTAGDAHSLRNALEAALRQTPDLFFVGETRRPYDWQKLVHFASTGHLLVTTSHAGSLTEAMGQLIRATKAESPALRSEIAKRLLAVIHLRAGKATVDSGKVTVFYTLPAIWTQTASSTKTFMSDGLTGLLPYRDKNRDKKKSPGCLGRTYFAEQLLESGSLADMDSKFKEAIEEQIRQTALQWDLEGV